MKKIILILLSIIFSFGTAFALPPFFPQTNIPGNAGTASALASDPAGCTGGQATTDINAAGVSTCTAWTANVLTLLGAADYAAFKASLSLGNVTNESKATMFTSPTFTTQITSPIVYGSAASGSSLTLQSTSHGTKGLIYFGTASAYDQVNDRLGIGTTAPGAKLEIKYGVQGALTLPLLINPGFFQTGTAAGIGFLIDGTPSFTKGALVYTSKGTGWNIGDFQFLMRNDDTYNPVTLSDAVMTIKANGNVGIGTIIPRYKNTTIGVLSSLLSDDGTNYEGLTITPAAGSVTFAAVEGGTGSDNIDLVLTPKGTGVLKSTNIYPATDDTYYLGKNSSTTPLAWKGILLKDTVTAALYRVEMISGVLTATIIP